MVWVSMKVSSERISEIDRTPQQSHCHMAVTVDLQNFFTLPKAIKERLYFRDQAERRPTPNLCLKLLQMFDDILDGFSGGHSGQLFWRVM